MERNNIHIMFIPEGEEKEEGTERIFKTVMFENFLGFLLWQEMDIQLLEAQKTPNILNLNRTTVRHIIISSKSKTKT